MYRSFLFMGFLVLSGACNRTPPDPEKEIRQAISALAEAVEARSISQFKDGIAASYHDHWGQNKRAIVGRLQLQFLRDRSIHTWTAIRRVQVAPDEKSAEVLLYLAVGARPISGLEGLSRLRADLLRFEIHLIREDDLWLVDRTNWRRARISEFTDDDVMDEDVDPAAE